MTYLIPSKYAQPWQRVPDDTSLRPGQVAVDKRSVRVGTATHAVALGEVGPPGKKPMAAADWARGARIAPDACFECPTPPGTRR